MSATASANVTIANRLGLHARPAMLFVETASKFNCGIKVRRASGGDVVDGKSIMQMMMLAATQGTQICISAEGDDAEIAVRALTELINAKFMED